MRSATIVPDFGQVPAGGLSTFNYRFFKTRMKSDLAASGVDRYFLAIDVSFDHVKGSRLRGYWQLHFHGVVLRGASPRIAVLKQLINASGRAPIQPRSVRPVTAYGLRSQYYRREWIRKSRPGRRPFWDTQARPLLGLPLVELSVFLDRIGLHGRLLTRGVNIENLQRARAIRAARQRAGRRRKVTSYRRPGKGGARH